MTTDTSRMTYAEERDLRAAYERDRWAGEWNSLPTAIDRVLADRASTAVSPDRIEQVAQVLYRQHRERDGHRQEFGEWDRAGSLQQRFRDDARMVLAALTQPA